MSELRFKLSRFFATFEIFKDLHVSSNIQNDLETFRIDDLLENFILIFAFIVLDFDDREPTWFITDDYL